MKNVNRLIDDWALRVFAVEKIRGIFEVSGYDALTDEQKIAFILAGGMPSLLHYQQVGTGSDTETGQLPVLC